MSSLDQTGANVGEGERLTRMICYAGLLALPVLTIFVHLLLIYRT